MTRGTVGKDYGLWTRLSSAICSLNVHEENIWVMLHQPRSKISPLTLIVAATLVELFVHGVQQLVELGRPALPGHELLQLLR